ncbi:hypothetical protein [Methylobacterium gnaphalii]|uniref:Glycosyl transferase n=1 Tax=Methylobacterium gnaphalii TaxID=1010610 RepID=A0A512JQV6_9HYPH|nr:hypothetical protein [Methylobacterium gnaphalii]GEP12334.1 hypothetical protein MGN01_41790 [Methylobacterium gnaphalii]GLS48544.1 hypothetical protein GCM10007885_13880 [Methylobacterium gnaphalii]
MISALILVAQPDEPEAVEQLADTLTALVDGVAAGLVADAVIVSAKGSEALETIADGSGAALVVSGAESPLRAAARAARRDWLLCLEAGDLPREGWIRSIDRFVGTARPDVSLARMQRSRAKPNDRLRSLVEGLIGVARPRPGDLVRRAALLAGSNLVPRRRPKILAAWLDRA